MEGRSHIDKEKLHRIAKEQPFEYRDIVKDDFPTSSHAEDGALFKSEVESGVYDNIKVDNPDDTHIKYKKI